MPSDPECYEWIVIIMRPFLPCYPGTNGRCLEVVADERERKWTRWEVSPDEQHADVVEENDEDEKKEEKLEE